MSNQIIQIKDGEDNALPVSGEAESNSNGRYLKLPDGTLICWNYSTYSIASSLKTYAVTFPHPFYNTPCVTCSSGAGGSRIPVYVEDVTPAGFTFAFFAATGNSTSWGRYIAIGRWK